ncbi:MAG: metallophosphoesterase [Nitrososphaeraceae archaeon]
MHKKFSSFSLIFILSFTALSLIYISNNSYQVYAQNLSKNDFNIIATADVGCSIRAQENIKNIEKLNPELFLVAGDLSYKKTPDCWFNMTKSLDSKTKVTIGNHDDYEEEGVIGDNFKKAVLDHYNLNNSYYSFDYKNVHVLALDTQLELSVDTLEALAITNETITDKQQEKKNDDEDKKDKTIEKIEPLNERYPMVNLDNFLKQNSIDVQVPKLEKLIKSNAKVPAIGVDENQYRFVLDDLEKTSMNKNIDWIIVLFHKPMYSSISKQFEEYIIRDKYQNIFDKYNVDLVIQGHNHIYARTFPLSLNPSNIAEPIVDKISDNMNNNNTFTNPNGTIFLVVGVGGAELHRIVEEPYYVANQYNKGFGFVDLNIDGKRLEGTFYDINLICNIKTTEKKEKEIMDLESCVPTPIDQNKLKVVDHFAIIK